MNIRIHQTHHTIADFDAIFDTLTQQLEQSAKDHKTPNLDIYPELYLTGYPLQDLCLQKSFVQAYKALLEKLDHWCEKIWTRHAQEKNHKALIGGILYELSDDGIPLALYNVIYELTPGQKLSPIYRKQLLPNYDIFDEKKYFLAGDTSHTLNWNDKNIGLLICEDMWPSNLHKNNPVKKLQQDHSIPLDAIVNLSASPFMIHKHEQRIQRAQEISRLLRCPFIYVNRVGAEDEILFDGQSFVQDGDQTLVQLDAFSPICADFRLEGTRPRHYEPIADNDTTYTWESLFRPQLDSKTKLLRQWNDDESENALKALCFGFQEYASKNGFKRFTLALSGGVDSALALAIIKLSLRPGQIVEAIYMPSVHSSSLSYECCVALCDRLQVGLKSLPIKFLHSAAKNLFMQNFPEPFEGLTDENVQSRLRGMLIYTRSNQINSMVVNTSNKSELAVGYSTQYGDSVGALSILGDLYKGQVYHLCHFINKRYGELIPAEIIDRAPSAELRPGQADTDSLPPYERLDSILEGLLSYRCGLKELKQFGFDSDEIIKVFDLYRKSEYKRSQFCPILKINSKSFGFGYRIPISKTSNFYVEEN